MLSPVNFIILTYIMKKYIIIGLICLAAIIATYFTLFRNGETVQYKTAKIEVGTIGKYVTATGTINPVRTVLIGSQVSGLVSKLYADFNSVVKVGQIMAQIDPVPFQHKVRMAEAALPTATASLEKAKVNAANNRKNYLRQRKLFAKKIISINDLDAARTTYHVSLADVKLSEAQVMQATASREVAKTDLEHTAIVSPLNGIVISRNVDVGQTVVASFQTPTLFNIAEDLVHMQIDTNVDEADIGMVAVGQEVKFTVDAFPDDVFEGKVTEIRMSPIIFQMVVTYDTIVSVNNSALKLKPGMTANTSILVASKEQVMKAPNAALRYTPSSILKGESGKKAPESKKPSEKAGAHIWLPERGKLKQVVVKPGIADDNFTEISSDEIKEGMEVVIAEISSGSATKTQQKAPWGRGTRY